MTANAESIKEWISQSEPIEGGVADRQVLPENGFSLLVTDPARLSPGVAQMDACSDLWREGLRAGGIPVQPRTQVADLRSGSETGATIVGLRARVTQRLPAADGALLECPAAGPQEPTQFAFAIGDNNVAEAIRPADGDAGAGDQAQFGNGFRLEFKKDEGQALALLVEPPRESIFWHYEADVTTDGRTITTIVLNDNGRDFYSPGSRASNEYLEGHSAGVDVTDWGVERGSRVVGEPGNQRLMQGQLDVPFEPGMEYYRPRPDSTNAGSSSSFWLRRDGRKLLSVNVPGSAPDVLPEMYDLCGGSANGDDDRRGYTKSKVVSPPLVEQVAGQPVERTTVDYVCSIGVGVARDGERGTPGYFYCRGLPCAESALRATVVRFPLANVEFLSWSNETATQDVQLVDRLLRDARVDGLPAGPAPGALAVEPVVPLPPAGYPDWVAGRIASPTDVGLLTAVEADSEGLVVTFDKVDYRACACPSGGAFTNVNSNIRRLRVLTETEIDATGGGSVTVLPEIVSQRRLVVLSRDSQGRVLHIVAQ
ncbi:hypothetical protein [Actinomycetospora flava]|uniref:Uncharacterized protein n=1 Tax=Actinomycetospora flava TaxID=3129232 RepID=A0ABU8M8K2_9PSEU